MYSFISPAGTDRMMESKINNEKQGEIGSDTGQNQKQAKTVSVYTSREQKEWEKQQQRCQILVCTQGKKEHLCLMTELYHRMGISFLQKVVVHEICAILVTTTTLTSKTGTEITLQKLGFQSSAKDYWLTLIKTFAFSAS